MSEFGPPDPNSAHNFVAPTPAVAPFAPPSPDAVHYISIPGPTEYVKPLDLGHIPLAPAPTMPNVLTITPADGLSTTTADLLGSLASGDPSNPWARSGPSVLPVIAPGPAGLWAPPNPDLGIDPSLIVPSLPLGHPDAPLIPWHQRPVDGVNPFVEKPKKRPPLVERAGLEHLVRPLTPLPPKKRGAIKWLRDATKPKTEHGGNLDIPKLKLRNLGRLAMHGIGSIGKVDRLAAVASLPRTRLEHTMIADRKSEKKAARRQARATSPATPNPKQPSRIGEVVRYGIYSTKEHAQRAKRGAGRGLRVAVQGAKTSYHVIENSTRVAREKAADSNVAHISRRAEAAHKRGSEAYAKFDADRHSLPAKESQKIVRKALRDTNRYHRLDRKAQGRAAVNAARRAKSQLKRSNLTIV